jgi:hypothetical protein
MRAGDAKTLATVIPDMEVLVGNTLRASSPTRDTGATMRQSITRSGPSSPLSQSYSRATNLNPGAFAKIILHYFRRWRITAKPT